jgi:hypothetical protein
VFGTLAIVLLMTTTKATKTQIKNLKLRLSVLHAELEQPLTKRCGAAAEKCIREDIATVEAELARVA